MVSEDQEVNAIVFLVCMLTVLTCSVTILYYRTSCILDPNTLRTMLKSRREMLNGYKESRPFHYGSIITRHYRQSKMDVIRIKRITTQYEILTKDQDA